MGYIYVIEFIHGGHAFYIMIWISNNKIGIMFNMINFTFGIMGILYIIM